MSEETKHRKMTPSEQIAAEKRMQKEASMQLSAYKKRLKESVELKQLQVEELELNIRYYNAKKMWLDLQPKVEELDARERAEIAKSEEEMRKMLEKTEEKAKEGEGKPLITIAKQGKSREE